MALKSHIPRQRWLLFAATAVLVLAIPVAIAVNQAMRQQHALATIARVGGDVRFADASADDMSGRQSIRYVLCSLFGNSLFGEVVEVNLRWTAAADDDLQPLSGLCHVRRLNLRRTAVTNAGVDHIAAVPGLEWLDVRETQITDDAVRTLRRRLPGLVVLHGQLEQSVSSVLNVPEMPPRPRASQIEWATPSPAFAARTIRKDAPTGPVDAGLGTKGVDTPGQSPAPSTVMAIQRGLDYLVKVQHADGSWSFDVDADSPVALRSSAAATGLALLAFLGDGHNHLAGDRHDVVCRGLEFLIDHQRANGDLFIPAGTNSDQVLWLYSHGIAALALCEAYGMTQDPWLLDAAGRAIDFICEAQDESMGGWRYAPGNGADTSVTGWIIMALKSGQLAGIDVPEKVWSGIERWLTSAQASAEQSHLYVYNPHAAENQSQGRAPNRTMTAVGLLMRLYLGWRPTDVALQRGADYLREHPPAVGSAADPTRDSYYWYYATQVMLHMGGQHWRTWNLPMHHVLVQSQVDSGPQRGSWHPTEPVPDRWGSFAGRFYVTTLNLLTLEVYYRHLPIYEDLAPQSGRNSRLQAANSKQIPNRN